MPSRIRTSLFSLVYLLRSGFGRSAFVRGIKYRWKYAGLSLDQTANLIIAGKLHFGERSAAGEGCNFLVPEGASLTIGSGCYVGRYVEIGPSGHISIGDNTSIQDRCVLVGDVHLGRYCVVSLNVLITSGRHYFDRWPHILIRDQDARVASDPTLSRKHSRPIYVEEDCWLGMNSVIMPGVTVGRGCVVGSNAVVTRDLPPYTIAVGAPARIVRRRLEFSPPTALDFSELEHVPYFYRGFEVADRERERNRNLGGHVARGDFALALKVGPARKLHLRAARVSSGKTVLTMGDRSFLLSDSLSEYEFDDVRQDDDMMNLPSFRVEGGPVVVSVAWTA